MLKYKIIPNLILENGNIEELVRGIYEYIPPYKRLNLRSNESDLMCLQNQKILEIKITKYDVEFNYYTDNEVDKDIYYSSYKGISLQEQDFSKFNLKDIENYTVGEMELKKHYFLALNTNKNEVQPLGALLEVQRILKADEEVIIHNILVPCEPSWVNGWENAYGMYRANKLPKRVSFETKDILEGVASVGSSIGVGVANTIQEILLVGTKDNKDFKKLEIEDEELKRNKRERPIRKATIDKAKSVGYDTTIRLFVKSVDKDRRGTIMTSLKHSYNHIAWDNELAYKEVKLIKKVKKGKIRLFKEVCKRVCNMEGANHIINPNILGVEEVSKLFLLPQISLQEEFNMTRTGSRQSEIPQELVDGLIKLGVVDYRTHSKTLHWFAHRDFMTLPKIVVGGMGSGKSSYTISYCVDSYKNNNCVIVFDYIDECPVANSIKPHIDKEDIIEITPGNLDTGLAFFYKEIIPKEDATIGDRKELASKFAEQIIYLINALNDGDVQPLSASMKRLLDGASQVTFLSGRYRVIDVINVLQDYVLRGEVIKEVLDNGIYEERYFKILDLRALDEVKKVKVKGIDTFEVVGTVMAKIDRIMDRVNILLRNVYLEEMLQREGDTEIDFVDIMQKNKVILIKLPESKFSSRWVKDVIVTYYLSRIWLASLLRAKMYGKTERNIVHLITDEIHQLDNATKVLFEHITESRKFGLAYFFTCQYLAQFKSLLEGVEGAKAHYMLLAGTHKNNFIALKEECGEFTLTELLNMKRFSSFNIVNTDVGVRRFITQLPKDLAK